MNFKIIISIFLPLLIVNLLFVPVYAEGSDSSGVNSPSKVDKNNNNASEVLNYPKDDFSDSKSGLADPSGFSNQTSLSDHGGGSGGISGSNKPSLGGSNKPSLGGSNNPSLGGSNNPPLGGSNNPPLGGSNNPPFLDIQKSDNSFIDSFWFPLSTGIASILSLLIALYPVQIRNLSPSVFRSLLWKKSLLTSIGVGILIFSGIQFYNQYPPPKGKMLGIYLYIHSDSYAKEEVNYLCQEAANADLFEESYSLGGTRLWGILFIAGGIMFFIGISIDPVSLVRRKMIFDGQYIRRMQQNEIKKILKGSSYNDLNFENKYLYKQILKYYDLIQSCIIELMAGTSTDSTKYAFMQPSLSTRQVKDILMQIKNEMKLEEEKLDSGADNNKK